jgi:hypothetical protein
MMKCHYISTQLERIQKANVGAGERLSSAGPTGLDEELQTMESAILRIRDEMRRQERPPVKRLFAAMHESGSGTSAMTWGGPLAGVVRTLSGHRPRAEFAE